MATSQHYVWASGQILVLVAATYTILTSVLMRGPSPFTYRTCYFGAIVSYSIVCHKSLGLPQPNAAFFRRAIVDENVQYLLLAIFWFSSKPVFLSTIPYAIFSLFHVLTFLRSNVLQHFFPPTAGPQGQGSTPHPIARTVQNWVKANYDNAMAVVAYTEILILGRVAIGALLWWNSLLAPLICAHFVRSRYYQSPFTRRALQHSYAVIDKYARAPGTPPVATKVWDTASGLVMRWGGANVAQANAPQNHR